PLLPRGAYPRPGRRRAWLAGGDGPGPASPGPRPAPRPACAPRGGHHRRSARGHAHRRGHGRRARGPDRIDHAGPGRGPARGAGGVGGGGRLAVGGAVWAGAVRLGEGALRSMLMSKLKVLAAVVLLFASLVVTGGGLRAYQARGDRPKGEDDAGQAGDAVQKA